MRADIQRIDLREFQSPTRLRELFEARHPFVARGAHRPARSYAAALKIFRRSHIALWDQQNDFFRTFRQTYETVQEGDACPCTLMSGRDVVHSDELDTQAHFQVVVRYIYPGTAVDRRFMWPVQRRHLWRVRRTLASTSLFNTLFVSKGPARGILHAHNYDVLGFFQEAGPGSKLYLYPTEVYGSLRSRCMPAMGGVVNFHNDALEDELDLPCIVHALEPGDLVHIPFGWYHRVDHAGDYLHLATSWFFPELLEARLAAVKPHLPAEEWPLYEAQTRRMLRWHLSAPKDFVVQAVKDQLPKLRSDVRRLRARLPA